jgi:polysaccharide pyruvyl transferase CsaB
VAIASNGGVYVKEIESVGIRHYSVPMHRRSLVPMVKSAFMLNSIIKKEKPDVVHAHARIPGFLCGIIKKFRKFPFVTTAHWVFDTGGALRFLTNWGDKTISVSDDIKDYLKTNYGVPDENIFITINGIDTNKFSPEISGEKVRKELKIDENATVISHVSRMDESRALAARFLIDMAPELSKAFPGVVILIAGGGDVFEELNGKAEKINSDLGYRCVIMPGARTDINEIVAAGDVFVGVSRAALEAMSGGKPTLVAGNEGYMGIFSEEKLSEGIESNFCCRGAKPIDHDTMLSDLTKLLQMSKIDKEKLGEYGRAVIMEHYSVGRMAEDALKAYRAAIPPKKIVMSGYYGFGNAGDEAILKSVYESVKENLPDAKVTVLSKTPEETSQIYGCSAVPRFNPIAVWKAIKKCDLLISGGGSLLQDTTSTRSLMYYLLIIRLAERMDKKVMLYANGVGPIRKDFSRKRTAKAVSEATAVTLRDPESLNTLRSMGVCRGDVKVTSDPVFLLEPSSGERADKILKDAGVPEGGFIAVSARPWKTEGFEDKIAEICDKISTQYNKNIVFLTMQPGIDDVESRAIAEKMKSKSYLIECGHNAPDLMSVIAKSDLVLSMRLHSLIFAARTATPSIGFDYDPKVTAYLKLLDQPSAGKMDDIDVEKTVNYAKDILENHDIYAQKLSEKRQTLTQSALKNNEVLKGIFR